MRKMDKRTALPLRIPKNGGGCTKRRPVLDVHDVKQRKLAVHAREVAPRTCTEIQLDRCARSRKCGRASARSGHVGRVALRSVTGPSGPSCLLAEGLARRRLVSRSLSDQSGREWDARLHGTRDSAVARSFGRPGVGGAEREAMWAYQAHRFLFVGPFARQGDAYLRFRGENQQ
jgi:hypothetical protein